MNAHVYNAVWLSFSLPFWYFLAALTRPFESGIFSLVPFVGTLALFAGVAMGIVKRRPFLLFFLLSPLMGECYVAIAGAMRGQVRGNAGLVPFWIFIVIQTVLICLLIYKSKGVRSAALSLSLFCASYAFYALFVGGMAFADSWL